ncbi:hypothetical protein VB618_15955 [Microvirga sp. CF3062]|uniref:hypothetical protein n=1 Tax=Microvirga sp. CF3062 TaxID=3110182 RepID=UPI002E7A8FCF|nr:hypothetical protein [Microvirga sp. CF3062]MEE1657701.1 hypothetical protein [Microvirga sp. CF3062]
MISNIEHLTLQQTPVTGSVYSPVILPTLQAFLAHLADLQVAYEKNLELIRQSSLDEAHKAEMIISLRTSHEEQRAPYVRELATLQERIEAIFG